MPPSVDLGAVGDRAAGRLSEVDLAGPGRRESRRFVQGLGQYVDDIDLPGILHVAFVRSALPHATVTSIDAREALALPGVVGVFTAADLRQVANPIVGTEYGLRAGEALAADRVRYVGDPVALVVAEKPSIAEDAVDLVFVDYQGLPAVSDPLRAMRSDSAVIFDYRDSNVLKHVHFATPGVDAAFDRADQVVTARFRSGRLAAMPIEPRAVIAHYRTDERLQIWTSTTGVYEVRRSVARSLSMSESRVEVIAPDVGGSFGCKNRTYPEELALPAVSKLLRRPVKWTESRTEHLAATRQGRDQIHDVEAAVDTQGRILGLRDTIIEDEGAALAADNALSSALLFMTGVYDITQYEVDAYSVATNKTPHGALRGIGKADAAWVIERLVDRIASRLGMDPAEVRLLNLVPADAFPYRTATGAILDSGRYRQALGDVLTLVDYEALRREQRELAASGVHRGIGMAIIVEPTSASRRDYGGGYAACRIRMDPSGHVATFPSIGQQGQGHQTVIAEIVANVLAMSPEDVEVFEADTAQVPFGPATGSSRSSVILMPAVHRAACLLRDKLLAIAAHRLSIPVDELVLDQGVVRGRGEGTGTAAITLTDLTTIAYRNIDQLPPEMNPGLEEIGYFKNPNIVWEPDDMGGHNEFSAYPYDAGVAVVDVDTDTGQVTLVRYASVHDCGTILNAEIVRTQHIGCIVHGIGAALYEEVRYNDEGDLASSSMMDYLIPTVNEVPQILIGHLETPSPFTPLGAKGAGETGMLTVPPAVGNAIEDALRSLAVEVNELPHTAVRVLSAIRHAASSANSPVEG